MLTQICKYCDMGFDDEIEMFVSLKFGYRICQECFSDIRKSGGVP